MESPGRRWNELDKSTDRFLKSDYKADEKTRQLIMMVAYEDGRLRLRNKMLSSKKARENENPLLPLLRAET